MIVKVKFGKYIDSEHYGLVPSEQEIDVIDSIGLEWIKMGLADGKDNGERDGSVKSEAKKREPKSNT